MLKNRRFLKVFLKGQKGHEGPRKNNTRVVRGSFWSKKLQKRCKKETNEPLDMKGKYDAYIFGLGGPKSENVEKPLVFLRFFEGGKGARTFQE